MTGQSTTEAGLADRDARDTIRTDTNRNLFV